MKVNIVCYEDTTSWILGKFALKLKEELSQIPGIECVVSSKAIAGYDVVHHIIYIADFRSSPGINTAMITHVDEVKKVRRVKELISQGVTGICMSDDTVELLIKQGCDKNFLRRIHPAHDFNAKPRKIKLLITSRLYEDGRKNEAELVSMIKGLNTDLFKLSIIGTGWENVVKQLREMSLEVALYPEFDSQIYSNIFSDTDYYLYLGFDEGSMGYLDALHAGVTPLVSLQGYHKDLLVNEGIYFKSISEIKDVLLNIQNTMSERIDKVKDLTWKNYALRHFELWNALLDRDQIPAPHNLMIGSSGFSAYLSMHKRRFLHIVRKLKSRL